MRPTVYTRGSATYARRVHRHTRVSACRARRIHLGDFSARTHRLALCVRSHARTNTRSSLFRARLYTDRQIVYVRARYAPRCPASGEEREYFVRFRSTGCNGGEPHCWPVSRPRLLGQRQRRRRRRRWWRRWWSRRTSCRRTACLKGRAVFLLASTRLRLHRACVRLRFACHRGARGVNFNTKLAYCANQHCEGK